jgi:BCCT family betaine/carnitine transporter
MLNPFMQLQRGHRQSLLHTTRAAESAPLPTPAAKASAGIQASELSIFGMLIALPLSGLMSSLAIVLALIFFVTSSDSGSLVVDTIAAGGKVDAPRPQRLFWAIVEGLIAIVLLLGGGLSALQAGVTATAIPFSIVMLVMCYTLLVALQGELAHIRR